MKRRAAAAGLPVTAFRVARVDTVSGERQEWIFDSSTLQFLGERDIQAITVHAMFAGTILGESAVLSRAIVDNAGQTS